MTSKISNRNSEVEQPQTSERSTRSWRAKAALLAGIGVPFGLLAIADPAAADFGGAPDDFETDQTSGSNSSDGTGGDYDNDADSYDSDSSDDVGVNIPAEPAISIPDGSGFDVIPGPGASEETTEPIPNLASQPSDSYVFGSYDTAGTNVAWTEDESGTTFTDETIAARREFFVPNEENAGNLTPAAAQILSDRGIDPAYAYTLKPGTYGYQSATNAAQSLEKLGLQRKADNLRQSLENEQFTAVFHQPERLSSGYAKGPNATINTASPPFEIVEMVTHESTHIDEFQSASPADEIDAYAVGIAASTRFANNPELLKEKVSQSAYLMTKYYEDYALFNPKDTTSALAAKTLEYLPQDNDDAWTTARTDLAGLVEDQTVTKAELRSLVGAPADAEVERELHPDGSATVKMQDGLEVNLKINPDSSRTLGHYNVEHNARYEDTYYHGELIGTTIIDYNTNVVRIKNELANSLRTIFQDGSQTLRQFNSDGVTGHTLTLDSEGELYIQNFEVQPPSK